VSSEPAKYKYKTLLFADWIENDTIVGTRECRNSVVITVISVCMGQILQ